MKTAAFRWLPIVGRTSRPDEQLDESFKREEVERVALSFLVQMGSDPPLFHRLIRESQKRSLSISISLWW